MRSGHLRSLVRPLRPWRPRFSSERVGWQASSSIPNCTAPPRSLRRSLFLRDPRPRVDCHRTSAHRGAGKVDRGSGTVHRGTGAVHRGPETVDRGAKGAAAAQVTGCRTASAPRTMAAREMKLWRKSELMLGGCKRKRLLACRAAFSPHDGLEQRIVRSG
eukprot:3087630-Rhodomonas_salina.2